MGGTYLLAPNRTSRGWDTRVPDGQQQPCCPAGLGWALEGDQTAMPMKPRLLLHRSLKSCVGVFTCACGWL